ncbi:MAG: phage portal protein [Clostridiales bacterium]|nr:phage portal protein [Clostridiales bacterium]
MICYLDRGEVPDLEDISPQVLRYLVRKAEAAAGRYRRLQDYYLGRHPSLQGKHSPDEVRVAVNYAKYVVDTALGYYLGEEVKYDPNARANEGGGAVDIGPVERAYHVQHIAEIDQELGRGMGIWGECLELCYASADWDPLPRSAKIDPANGILVCDTTVEHNKLFALLWDRRETTAGERYYSIMLLTDRTVKTFRSATVEMTAFRQEGETQFHWFGAVPVIAYENNGDRQGDFEQVISLIDAYDDLMSSRLTDKRKFVDALLVFFGMTLREGDESRLAKEKFLDGAPLDARAEYIQKTFDEESVQVLADALVRDIHKMTMTVDMSDQQFAGNSSGQALKLKLLTMNLLVKNKMRRMERGLKERLALYNHYLTVKGEMQRLDVDDVDVVFTLNTPINEEEIVTMVTSLQGIVDDQTLLGQLWFIRDPAEALRNIRAQRKLKQEELA